MVSLYTTAIIISLGCEVLVGFLIEGILYPPKQIPIVEDHPLPDSIERLLPPGVASGFRNMSSEDKTSFYNAASPEVQEIIRKVW